MTNPAPLTAEDVARITRETVGEMFATRGPIQVGRPAPLDDDDRRVDRLLALLQRAKVALVDALVVAARRGATVWEVDDRAAWADAAGPLVDEIDRELRDENVGQRARLLDAGATVGSKSVIECSSCGGVVDPDVVVTRDGQPYHPAHANDAPRVTSDRQPDPAR